MTYRVFLPLFIAVISACSSDVIEKPIVEKLDIRLSVAELDSLKSFIIEEYWKYDSAYYSPSDNCYFRQFVENELEGFGYHYQTVYQGISIKHYHFPYTKFNFNLVRGSDGTFYYVGLGDLQYMLSGILEEEFYQKLPNGDYKLTYEELPSLPVKSSTASALNHVLARDTLFSSNLNSSWALMRAEGFVFHNYKYFDDMIGGVPSRAIFDRALDIYTIKESMKKLKGGVLTDNELKYSHEYQDVIMKKMNEKMQMFTLWGTGILRLHFKNKSGKVTLNQSFIPAKKRSYATLYPSIDSLIDWSLYEECRP